ncbi:MAG TPA: NAD(P)H-dependent oxidoreductase [Flavisolibacter sp.]|jgi:glutathione-regulated potassium-efflux system ancillary protein KefG
MAKVLILFAHPVLEKSRVQKQLIRHVQNLKGVTFHDLYEAYPTLDIDVKHEQQLLLDHDVIIFQHPFYWYSSPAIIKQWLDLVLEHGWAYGSSGVALTGKKLMNAISCGGPRSVYSPEGRNRFSIRQFLAPFDQTAVLCKMKYMPPFAVHGTHRLTPEDIEQYAVQFRQLLSALVANQISDDEWNEVEYLNDLISVTQSFQS